MNALTRSIGKIMQGAGKAFTDFPVSIASALGFAVVTMVRIQLDWPQQEPYNFLFNCLHWSLALGAILGLALMTKAKSQSGDKKTLMLANLLSVAAVLLTFIALYFWGASNLDVSETRYATISNLAAARVGVLMLLSLLAFMVWAAHPPERSDFSQSFFMTLKAFFIAAIYGVVMMSGSSGVAGAIVALLYAEMSSKVYMYLGTISGFLAFTIFVGYFPDFRLGQEDPHREVAQKQPRFVEVLFGSIMIPIMLALTVVLLIWAARTMFDGIGASFVRLSSIASAYTLYGLWLHVMVTHHDTNMAKFYRRAYPWAALVILAFEAWAWILQMGKTGLQLTEYFFLLIWIFAVCSSIFLLLWHHKAHRRIVILLSVLAVFTVLPILGYQALPVSAQVQRLEGLLQQENMLRGGEIVPAAAEPELEVRESITSSVQFLAYAQDAKLPVWFDTNLAEEQVFVERFGFAKVWPDQDDFEGPGDSQYLGVSLMRPAGVVDVSEYDYAIRFSEYMDSPSQELEIAGDKGTYTLTWVIPEREQLPQLQVTLNGQVIVDETFDAYIDQLMEKYPPGEGKPSQASLEDLSYELETPEIRILLLFSHIDVGIHTQEDYIYYWVNLDGLYLQEKP